MWRLTAFVLSLALYLFVAIAASLGPRPAEVWKAVLTAFVFGGLLPFYVRAARAFFLCDSISLRLIKRGQQIPIRASDRWIISAVALLVSLASLELFLHLRTDERIDFRAYDPFLQAVPIAGDTHFHINAEGFRADEIAVEKPQDVFRVVFLGGSTVYAGDVPFEKSHARLLESMLQAQYPERSIEVINAAVPWYTSAHSLIKYTQKIQDYDPDLVVMWHGINDLVRSFSPRRFAWGSFQRDYSHYLGPITRLVFSYFGRPTADPLQTGIKVLDLPVNLVKRNLARSGDADPREVGDFPSLASFRRNLRNLAQLTELHGVQLVLASQPSLYGPDLDDDARAILRFFSQHSDDGQTYTSLSSMAPGMALFNDTARGVAEETGVPFIDLALQIPRDVRHFLDDVHYTELGNQRVAEVVFQNLVDLEVVTGR